MQVDEFTNDFKERLSIASIASRLTPAAGRARRRILAHTLAAGRPFNVRVDAGLASPEEIAELRARNAMVIDNLGNVPFIYPVSALPTHHQVTLADGCTFSAMCAIDAMGATFTFGQDTAIRSKCSFCEMPVRLRLRQGRIEQAAPPDGHVLHMDLNQMADWSASC